MTEVRRPAYRVTTPRLVLRCLTPADAPLIEAAIDTSLPELLAWMPWAAAEPLPREERVAWLRTCRGNFDLGTDFIYGMFSADERRFVGGTGLHARQGRDIREIGYWVATSETNKGLATEAAAALVQVAFRIDRVRRVEIRCDTKNLASAKVAGKLGFVLDGTLRSNLTNPAGELRDTHVFSMLDRELDASPAAKVPIAASDAVGARLG